jgi:hypothetical protein
VQRLSAERQLWPSHLERGQSSANDPVTILPAGSYVPITPVVVTLRSTRLWRKSVLSPPQHQTAQRSKTHPEWRGGERFERITSVFPPRMRTERARRGGASWSPVSQMSGEAMLPQGGAPARLTWSDLGRSRG